MCQMTTPHGRTGDESHLAAAALEGKTASLLYTRLQPELVLPFAPPHPAVTLVTQSESPDDRRYLSKRRNAILRCDTDLLWSPIGLEASKEINCVVFGLFRRGYVPVELIAHHETDIFPPPHEPGDTPKKLDGF